MMNKKLTTFLAIAAFGFAAQTNGATIFSDNFTAGTNGALNGQAPQERPGLETWRASSNYTVNIAGDGVVTSSGSGSANLALPAFDLNSIYTVTATVTNNRTDTNWIGIGFTTQTTNTNAWNVAGTGTYWMLWRGNDEIRAFDGTGATSSSGATGVTAAGVSNTLDLRVMLDFTAPGFGLATYMYKNPNATDWTIYTTSNITEARRNGINSVGFTTLNNNISISSFEYALVPEPSSALLGGLGLLALLRRRR